MPPELMRLILSATQRTQTMPQHLERMLASPFVRDTLVPWFGVNPQVQADPRLPPEVLAETVDRGRVSVNRQYGQQGYPASGRGLPEVLAHEFAHVGGNTSGSPINETRYAFDQMRLPSGLPLSDTTPDELRAYAVEVAMRQIRAGAKTKEQVPAEIRQKIPGFDMMFDWLQSRARQTEYDRRFGRPLPPPDVRDSVRMRIRP